MTSDVLRSAPGTSRRRNARSAMQRRIDPAFSLAHLWTAQILDWSDPERRDEGRTEAARALVRSAVTQCASIHRAPSHSSHSSTVSIVRLAGVRHVGPGRPDGLHRAGLDSENVRLATPSSYRIITRLRTGYFAPASKTRLAPTCARPRSRTSHTRLSISRLDIGPARTRALSGRTNRLRMGFAIAKDTEFMGAFRFSIRTPSRSPRIRCAILQRGPRTHRRLSFRLPPREREIDSARRPRIGCASLRAIPRLSIHSRHGASCQADSHVSMTGRCLRSTWYARLADSRLTRRSSCVSPFRKCACW